MNNQTTEQLKRIDAKRTLGLPLTPSENAFYTLYGNFETIAAPLVDIIKADPTDIEPSEATQKTAFVHGYLSPLLRAAGFQIKSMPIWVKNNFGIGYYTRPQYEPMYLAIKGNPPPPDTAISDVLNYPRVVKQVHTCEKPIPLLQRLISTFSREGDVIFDGFAGGVQPLLPPENCGVNIFVLNSTKITSILRHRVSKTNLRKRRFCMINGRGERR